MDEPCIHYVKQTKPIAEGYKQHAIYIKRFSMKNNSLYCSQIHIHTPMGKINASEEGRGRKTGK